MTFSNDFKASAAFDPLGDPQRQKLMAGAARMAGDVAAGNEPYSLTLLGPSGIGKTHLARALHGWAKRRMPHKPHPTGLDITNPPRIAFLSAADACSRYLGGEYGLLESLQKVDFLVLDDIGTERDPKLTFRTEIQHLIDRRLGTGWTVLTSNYNYEQLHTEYDARIASRLIRNGGLVVNSKATDYTLHQIQSGNRTCTAG